MAEDKISSLFDLSALQKESDRVRSLLGETLKTNLPKIKLQVEGAASVKEFTLATTKMNEELKAVESLAKQRFATDAKIITLQTDYAKATAANRVEIQKQNAELKAQAQLQAASFGSVERARAAVKVLTIEQEKLNITTAEGAKRSEELNTKIDKYNEFIRKNKDTLAQQKINVGNYSGAISILKTTLDEVGRKIDSNTKAGKGNSEATKAMVKEQAILRQLVDSQAAGFAKASMEIRANEKALLDLSRAGLQGSETYKQLALATGKLKDDLADVRARTKALGSDTFVFDGLIQGAQTLAGIYGVAQGATALFGEENEELAKTMVKLQAAMAIIQGLQSVANGLQKENAAILLLQQAREKAVLGFQVLRNFVLRGSIGAQAAATAATQADTGVKVVNTVATRAATAATVSFRAALIATGIGAILVLLVSAASAMGAFGDETEAATEDLDSFNRRLQFSQELLEGQVESIRFAGQLAVEKAKQRGATDTQVSNIEIDNLKRVKAAYDANAKDKQDALDRELSKIKGFNKEKAEALAKEVADNKKASQATGADIILKGEQERTRIAQKGIDDRKKAREKASKDARDAAERNRKALFQIARDSAEERAALALRDAENEDLPLERRLQRLIDYNNERLSILTAQKNFDLQNEKLTAKEKEAIINKFHIETRAQNLEAAEQNLQILKTAKQKEVAEYKKAIEDLQAQQEKLNETGQFKNDQNRNAELLQAAKDFSAGRIKTAEDLAKKEQEINDKYDKIALNAEIKHQLQLLVIKKAAGQNVDAELKALQGLKDRADEVEIANAKKKGETLLEVEQRIKEERKALLEEAQDSFFFFLQAGIEKEIGLIEERQRLLDEATRRQINNINLLGLTEVERVRQTAIVEKNAAFQNEQLEKRKRELKVQSAKYEKAQSIVSIIQSTSQAVMATLAQFPGPKGLILAGITAALGALQLAKVIATPLPRYKQGRGKGKDEWAITGDGGKREPIVRADGRIELSPARDTLTYLAKNDMVFPDISSLMRTMHAGQIKPQQVKVSSSDPELRNQLRELISVTKKTKTTVQVHNHTKIETTAWYQNHIKN